MSALTLYAGPVAKERILREGIQSEQFRVLVGASGGPKWFVLYGLDRYLFGEFFSQRQSPLLTLGSSAGAWRLSCLATANPVNAIDELARRYSGEVYSEQPSTAEITSKMRNMLVDVLGPTGVEELVNNPHIHTHVVADRCHGIGNSASDSLRKLFLGSSALANVLSRNTLDWFYERNIFSSMGDASPWQNPDKIKTRVVKLTPDNVLDALLASGSIPFILDGVRDIAGAQPGLYLDGGITDYHFDFKFADDDALVLYPHFSAQVVPGWFDKFLPWRSIHNENFSNVLFLTPSTDFIASLPNGKIPDRNDFENYSVEERMEIWSQVLERSKLLADEFANLISKPVAEDRIRSLEDLNG